MKDEELIGQEFEGVEFKNTMILKYNSAKYEPLLGKTGVVQNLHSDNPDYCLVKFGYPIGHVTEVYFPTAVVKQQIEDRVPIDLDELFKNIKSL